MKNWFAEIKTLLNKKLGTNYSEEMTEAELVAALVEDLPQAVSADSFTEQMTAMEAQYSETTELITKLQNDLASIKTEVESLVAKNETVSTELAQANEKITEIAKTKTAIDPIVKSVKGNVEVSDTQKALEKADSPATLKFVKPKR